MNPLLGLERRIYELFTEPMRLQCEQDAQQLVDAWEAEDNEVKALRHKRTQHVTIVTFFGPIRIRCRKGRNLNGQWICPAKAYLGLRPNQWYSPSVEHRMAIYAVEAGSYEKAAELSQTSWFNISPDAILSIVQRLGAVAETHQPDNPCATAASSEDVLIVMADGWNARHRGNNWGEEKTKTTLPDRVHWHEIRSACIFKQSDAVSVSEKRTALLAKHIVATPADTPPLAFGQHLQQEMFRMGAAHAKHRVFVMDGAAWLWNIFEDRFERCSSGMLDFYHLSQHLHILANALHGEGTEKSKSWCKSILHALKHDSPKKLFRTLAHLVRSPPSNDPIMVNTIREQNQYFRNHETHMDYANHRTRKLPIGSGSVESLCSQFQNRMKRTGQFWSKQGFGALLRLIIRHRNKELLSLWFLQAA